MEPWVNTTITVICSVMASSGFWAFVSSRSAAKSAERQMLMGLGHDRIMDRGNEILKKGYCTTEEYDDIEQYLYAPYAKMGGNGSAKRMMDKLRNLPSRKPEE